MVCKNCGAQTKGNYCAHCGQSTSVGPINLSNLLKELPNNFLQLNRGFLYTLVMLFRRPGVSIRAYLQGQRKRYTKPIT